MKVKQTNMDLMDGVDTYLIPLVDHSVRQDGSKKESSQEIQGGTKMGPLSKKDGMNLMI